MAWGYTPLNLQNQPGISPNWSAGIMQTIDENRAQKKAADVLLARRQAQEQAMGPDGKFNAQTAAQYLLGAGDLEGGRAYSQLAENEADREWRRQEAERSQRNADRSYGLQAQALARRNEDTPEYRAQVAGRYGLDINSPEGRSFVLTGSLPPNRQARVPAAIQNAEASDLEAVQSIGTINSELNRFKGLIDGGKLPLGGWSNMVSRGQNLIGASDEGSRNFASFSATLEKLRNESLRLNKGVQTEGDSQRAWDELIANINDPEVVKQRIDEITRLNNVAAEFKRNLITQRREDNNLNPLDIESLIALPSSGQPTPPPPAQPQIREGMRARNPQTGETIIFQNGQWVPAR